VDGVQVHHPLQLQHLQARIAVLGELQEAPQFLRQRSFEGEDEDEGNLHHMEFEHHAGGFEDFGDGRLGFFLVVA
jgi:hypothetical protein